MDYTSDSVLDPGRQVQIQQQFSANGAQANRQYVKSAAVQQAEAQGASALPTREAPSQPPMMSNHLNQNVNLSQQEHLPDIGIWRNGVTPTTAMPLFGGDSYSRSLFTIPDDFIQFLFNGDQPNNPANNDNPSLTSFPG